MKVKEIIEGLKNVDPESEVCTLDLDNRYERNVITDVQIKKSLIGRIGEEIFLITQAHYGD